MNRVDDDWLLAMTQVEYMPPVRRINLRDQDSNYDRRTGRRGGCFDQAIMRGTKEHPWRATCSLPRDVGWVSLITDMPNFVVVTSLGESPLAAMERCWDRLVNYLMRMSDLVRDAEQVE